MTNRRHGHTSRNGKTAKMSRTYQSWSSMCQRCTNPKNPDFKDYGGRGIRFEIGWIRFEAFLRDMGERPPNTSLDRRDNNKNYTKENCRWATQKEQHNNKRSNHILTVGGEAQTISQWARRGGVKKQTILSRLSRGWPEERAVMEKPNGKEVEHGPHHTAVHRESVLRKLALEEAHMHHTISAFEGLVERYGRPRLIKEMDETTFWKLQGYFIPGIGEQ